jgi:hypothetical protein
MKKISLFALAVITSTAIFAQNDKPARTSMEVKPRLGIKGGVNLASLEIDDDTPTTNFNTNSKTSFHVGVYGNIPFGTGMFRLQPELLYIGQGSKVTGTPLSGNQGQSMSYEVDMDYIALPIMLQLATKSGFFVEVGPQFSFLTTARQDNATGNDPDLKDQGIIKKTDFAVLGGLGFTSRIGLGVHATYIHGISNVFDTDNNNQVGSPIGGEVSNRGIKIGLHYSFGAHK